MKSLPLTLLLLCLTLFVVHPTAHAQRMANAPAPGYATINLDIGYEGEDYSASVAQVLKDKYRLKLTGSSRQSVFEWVAVDEPPPGLTIDAASGQIFGTLLRARPQSYLFRVHVFDKSVTNPAPLRLQLSLQIERGPRPGPAPKLVSVDSPDETNSDGHEAHGNGGDGNSGYGNGNGNGQQVQPTAATNGGNAGQSKKDSAAQSGDKPKGKPQAGTDKGKKKKGNVEGEEEGGEGDESGEGDEGRKGEEGDDDDEKKITVIHTGTVAGGAASTPITVVVKNDAVKTIKISVEEKKGDAAATPMRNYFPEPLTLNRGEEEYPVVVPLAEDRAAVTLVTVRGFDKDDKEIEVSEPISIARGVPSVRPRVEVGYSGLVNLESTSIPLSITANDPKINTLKIVVTPKGKDEVTYFDIVTLPRGEDSMLKVIGIPSADEITVKVYDVSKPEDVTPEQETPEQVRALIRQIYDEGGFVPAGLVPLQTLQIERRSGGSPVSTIVTNSLNTRAIIGFEQAGASSANSKSQPFLDFFFTAPMRFRPKSDSLPRVSAWGQVRLAAVPQQVSTFGTLPANFVSPLVENKLTDLVQGFDFMAGLEVRVFGTNKPYVSLIPGVKNQTFLNIVGGGGAISPLSESANRSAAQIFAVPGEGSPQRELFAQRYPEAVKANANYIAFVFPDRDRFLRQYYAGVRFKTFYYNDDGTLINRFPAIFDFMIGQNEAVTGGRLKSDITDNNGKLIGRERRYVLRLEAFYPFPIREANFLYLYGTAMMKVGGGGVKIDTPLFLNTAPGEVNVTTNGVFVTPTLQTNRDYYRFGIGVNLTELFNRTPPRERR